MGKRRRGSSALHSHFGKKAGYLWGHHNPGTAETGIWRPRYSSADTDVWPPRRNTADTGVWPPRPTPPHPPEPAPCSQSAEAGGWPPRHWAMDTGPWPPSSTREAVAMLQDVLWWLRRSGSLPDHSEHLLNMTLAELTDALLDDGSAAQRVADGRYEGGNHEVFVDLRVDEAVSQVISADIFRNGATGRDYVASIRTAPGLAIALDEGVWPIVAEDKLGAVVQGELALRDAGDNAVDVSLLLEGKLEGLPARRPIGFRAERVSADLRTIAIEQDSEIGTEPSPAFETGDGRHVTLESVLANAGFSTIRLPGAENIPQNLDDGWGTAQLHTLMADFADLRRDLPLWAMHLLWLGHPSRKRLFGIMYDAADSLPRQGLAVFEREIRKVIASRDAHEDRKIIQTTAHEIGHALNLAHRFERVVGRADSTSIMNYDWRYRGGGRRSEFWDRFDFRFDDDELEFLRHAPRNAVIPGGAAFHSINYWADGNGGYSPYFPEVPVPGLELTINPPTGGTNFLFGQQVFLGVKLRNLTGRRINLPQELLDIKGGVLEVLVRRLHTRHAELAHFVPVLERCFDITPSQSDIVNPGDSIENNIQITFGSGGFTFAEPGDYEVTALVVVFDRERELDLIVRSNSLVIHIGRPHSAKEERESSVLMRQDVGLYFALGGSDLLEDAAQDLEVIRRRRQGKKRNITDPIVSNIVRCAGINTGRRYLRLRNGKFEKRAEDRGKAAELLEGLTKNALYAFDKHTAESTVRLAAKHRAKIVGKKRKN